MQVTEWASFDFVTEEKSRSTPDGTETRQTLLFSLHYSCLRLLFPFHTLRKTFDDTYNVNTS